MIEVDGQYKQSRDVVDSAKYLSRVMENSCGQ
jgi:hypothetical protein